MKLIKSVILLTFVLFLSGIVHAQLQVTIERVDIEDIQVLPAPGQNLLDIERGKDVDVRVKLSARTQLKDVEVHAFISGYEYSDVAPVYDATPTFDMDSNVSYVKHLKLRLSRLVKEDAYKLRILVSDRFNSEVIQNFDLKIDVPRHSVDLVDVIMTPQGKIQAGRALLVSVRAENFGQNEEEDLRVQVSIPDLGATAVDYINKVKTDKQEQTQELYLKIPRCAKPGVYQVKVDVLYDNGHRTISKSLPVEVTPDDLCEQSQQPQTVINMPSSTEHVLSGSSVTLPVSITNNGVTNRAYTLTVTGTTDWADVKITPSTMIVVAPKTAQTAYVTLSVSPQTLAGTKSLSVAITSGAETLQQVAILVPVDPLPSTATTRSVLEVLLAVLIAVLVMLALVIGFMHWKKQDDQNTKPYY